MQAHDQAIRSMVWSHNDNWMVSGDDGGAIKYIHSLIYYVLSFILHIFIYADFGCKRNICVMGYFSYCISNYMYLYVCGVFLGIGRTT